jgi:hypothetical protein
MLHEFQKWRICVSSALDFVLKLSNMKRISRAFHGLSMCDSATDSDTDYSIVASTMRSNVTLHAAFFCILFESQETYQPFWSTR